MELAVSDIMVSLTSLVVSIKSSFLKLEVSREKKVFQIEVDILTSSPK